LEQIMNKRLIASFTLASYLAIPAAAVIEDQQADLLATRGKVLTRTAGSQSWSDTVTAELQVGDSVRTGLDGEVVLTLPGNGRLRLAPQTEVSVTEWGSDKTIIQLERGRVLGAADGNVSVKTPKTVTRASTGSFVVATSAQGTALEVLSGNAALTPIEGGAVQYAGVAGPYSANADQVLANDGLNSRQFYGEVALLADQWKGQWKGKGEGTRSDDDEESVGGSQRTSPDSDILEPVDPPTTPPPTTTPPTTTPPVTTTPPTTTPPTATTPPTTPPPAAVKPGGFPVWGGLLIGAGVIGGVIAIASDDDDRDFVSPGIPSPSLP
jgi:hypothetical protein